MGRPYKLKLACGGDHHTSSQPLVERRSCEEWRYPCHVAVRFETGVPAPHPFAEAGSQDGEPNAISLAGQQALAALADPTRREIFRRALHTPRPVRDIAKGLPVSRPAVSQHLRVLKEAGLVTYRRAGLMRLYTANPEAIGRLVGILEKMWREAVAARKTDSERSP
jgi:DNA-binding transcriptional ArsR family regulator